MRITTKGQVTIPIEIRERMLSLLRGSGTVPMSTDEILALTRGD